MRAPDSASSTAAWIELKSASAHCTRSSSTTSIAGPVAVPSAAANTSAQAATTDKRTLLLIVDPLFVVVGAAATCRSTPFASSEPPAVRPTPALDLGLVQGRYFDVLRIVRAVDIHRLRSRTISGHEIYLRAVVTSHCRLSA